MRTGCTTSKHTAGWHSLRYVVIVRLSRYLVSKETGITWAIVLLDLSIQRRHENITSLRTSRDGRKSKKFAIHVVRVQRVSRTTLPNMPGKKPVSHLGTVSIVMLLQSICATVEKYNIYVIGQAPATRGPRNFFLRLSKYIPWRLKS